MKKIALSLTSALLVLVLMVGCGGGNSPTRGTWDGNTFTNTYANLTFEKPDGWNIATDDEIANLMGVSADLLKESGINYNKTLLKMQNLYDMMVQDPLTGSNVIIMYENLSMAAGGTKIEESEYADIVVEQLSQTGMYTNFGDPVTETIGKNTYTVFTAQNTDMQLYQSYLIRKDGKYMTAVILTSMGDNIDSMKAMIS